MKTFAILLACCLVVTSVFYALSLQSRTIYERQIRALEQHRVAQQLEELFISTQLQTHQRDVQYMSGVLFAILNHTCSLCYIQEDCHTKDVYIQDKVNTVLIEREYEPFSTQPSHKIENGVLSLLWDHHHQNGEHAICHTCIQYAQQWLTMVNQSDQIHHGMNHYEWPAAVVRNNNNGSILIPEHAIYIELSRYIPNIGSLVEYMSWYFATHPYSVVPVLPLVCTSMFILFYYYYIHYCCRPSIVMIKKPLSACYDPAPLPPPPPPPQPIHYENNNYDSSSLQYRYLHD